jgi:methyltransferase-like protein/SAM-dependent methyltransferase
VNSYDEIPYEATPAYETHPDRLATAAALAGLNPAPLARCRVLELGCANGGNLLPIAEALPQARFVGVDLSAHQIEEGRERIAAAAVKNLELHAGGIGEVELGGAPFDYIICHGVYSWVPDSVQARIFAVTKRMLAKNGVAYISYNTYPGWHRRGILRDALMFHAERFGDAREKIRESRFFLELLAASTTEGDYGRLLKHEAEQLRDKPDAYLFHEHLEERNQPCYFYEFAHRAAENGLQYLNEAAAETVIGDLPHAVQERLRRAARDRVDLEQYLDFIRNRTFRRSLVCHAEATLDRAAAPAVVPRLWARSLSQPAERPVDVRGASDATFRAEGNTVTTDGPLMKAVLLALHELEPRLLDADALWAAVVERLGDAAAPFRPEHLPAALLRCHASNLIALHAHLPAFTLEPGERPRAGAVARLQAERGVPVTNALHQVVELDAQDHVVLPFLDGRRTRAEVVEVLVEAVQTGALEIEHAGVAVEDPASLRAFLAPMVQRAIVRMASVALLTQ